MSPSRDDGSVFGADEHEESAIETDIQRQSVMRHWYREAARIALMLVCVGCRTAPAPVAPDVILIVVDTLRADHVSVYGYPRRTAPALEQFARDAVVYDDAISPGTWTVPAHAALFTGRWPSFGGAERIAGDRVLATPMNVEVPTLAEILGSRGFDTAAFVGNATYVTPVLGFARGFREFSDHKLEVADRVRSAFNVWLSGRRGRLFVFMNILDPHEPYMPPKPYDTQFPGYVGRYGGYLTPLVYAGEHVTPEMEAHFISQYDGEIAYTDQILAGIFADLKQAGRYEQSLVIVTSDHGELLGEHGLAGHGVAPFQELLHVPLLVKYPANARRGTRVRRRVSTLGVFATVLATVGIETPARTQARPLDDEHPVWVEDVDALGRRVRVGYEGPWKLVSTSSPKGTTTELYDLAHDPAELRPLHDTTGAPALRAALAAFENDVRPVNNALAPVVDPEREVKLRELGYLQ